MKTALKVPLIIADDDEKVRMFRAGYDHNECSIADILRGHPAIKKVERSAVDNAFCRDDRMHELPPRERALVNCWKWGRAIKNAETPEWKPWLTNPTTVNEPHAWDSFDFVTRNGRTFFSVAFEID
jgi:hypothetical protein